MNNTKRSVPWANWRQWKYVRDLLYSTDPNDQYDGIDIVEAWKYRSSNLPVAVETTALFTSLILKMDSCLNQSYCGSAASDYTHLHYAAALAMIRMVNGIIDVEQKGVYSKSINVLAEEIGLPRYFVDLRHRCTHSDMPSFEVLLLGLKDGKHWLYDFYWQKQEESLQQYSNSIISQLELVSHIACTSSDASIFHKKGEINMIMKKIFTMTPTTECTEIIIPSLTGYSTDLLNIPRPLVLPDCQKDCVSQEQWIENWSQIIAIAIHQYPCFLFNFMEHIAIAILQLNLKTTEIDLLLNLMKSLCSYAFYKLVMKKEGKSQDRLCSQHELNEMDCNINSILFLLLRSSSLQIIQFVLDQFAIYLTEEQQSLALLRKEMCEVNAIRSLDMKEANTSSEDESIKQMNVVLQQLNESRPSYLLNGNMIKTEYDQLPIGSILF